MNANVEKFFEIYDEDEALQEKVQQAIDGYPGSLEIRESVVEYALLPQAEALGLPFTVSDLRAYETKKKMAHFAADDGTPEPIYWLLDHGWTDDERKYKEIEKKLGIER